MNKWWRHILTYAVLVVAAGVIHVVLEGDIWKGLGLFAAILMVDIAVNRIDDDIEKWKEERA